RRERARPTHIRGHASGHASEIMLPAPRPRPRVRRCVQRPHVLLERPTGRGEGALDRGEAEEPPAPSREASRRDRRKGRTPAGAAAASSSLPGDPCAGPGRELRTLIVGNSQIYFFDLPKILTDLSHRAR